jgi:hypothetical protein
MDDHDLKVTAIITTAVIVTFALVALLIIHSNTLDAKLAAQCMETGKSWVSFSGGARQCLAVKFGG